MIHSALLIASQLLAPLVACKGSICAPTLQLEAVDTPSEESTPELLQRVVVIGASVSGGYGITPELVATARFGDFLECLLPEDWPEVEDLGNTSMFTDPHKLGARMIEGALKSDPTLVVAVDFLFWFSYSSWRAKGDRAEELEAGLALLDRLDCPIVLGNLPDMSPAIGGVGPHGGPMLTRSMVPSESELDRFNERIESWAKERGNVTIVPMAEMVSTMLSGEELVIRGNRWPAGSLSRLLQKDLLHPNIEGTIALSILVFQSLSTSYPELSLDGLSWQAEGIRSKLMERTEEVRQKRLDRKRRWEERRNRRSSGEDESGDGG